MVEIFQINTSRFPLSHSCSGQSTVCTELKTYRSSATGTPPSIHDFWTMEGEERHHNKINFLKNMALLGGAIILLEEAAK